MTTTAADHPTPPNNAPFQQALALLEFDAIRQRLAAAARTALGAEAAAELTPSADPHEVAVRQQETAEARRLLETDGALELGPAADLRPSVRRAALGGTLPGGELRSLGALAGAARWNRPALSRRADLPLLASIAENLPQLPELENAVNRAIGPGGEVQDNASPELARLRRESRAAHAALNDVMQRALRRYQRTGVAQENIVTERNGRMVLLIKNDFKGQAPGIIHDVSDSGATVFVEPMPAIALGNRWRETRLAEQREEERILRELSALVAAADDEITLALHLLGRLDLATAKARYAAALRAVPPQILPPDEPRRLRLAGARHPLLTPPVVPTTITVSADRPVLLITGPNAGGKTVALKTAGLLALMAHAGLQIPADDAVFPLLDGVFADIGDQQSIFESLSTFSSHIRNLRRIMDAATPRSLILIDELGSATDPEEGSALAIALLSHLRDRGTMVVATTHHRNVARRAQDAPGMLNASVDLNPRSLEPTYHLTHGIPGRSYALTIAARLGLPDAVIAAARTHLEPAHLRTDRLLQELQEERLTVSELRRQAEAALAEARRQEQEAAQQLATVEDTKAQLVEDARRELAEQIRQVSDDIRRAERTLQQPPPLLTPPPPAAAANTDANTYTAAGANVGSAAGANVGSAAGANAATNTDSDPNIGSDADANAAGANVGAAGSANVRAAAGSNVGAAAGANADANTDADSDPNVGAAGSANVRAAGSANADANTDADSDPNVGADAGLTLPAARRRLDQTRREIVSPEWTPIPVARPPWYHDLRPGDRVYIRGVARPVEVVTAANDQQEIEVVIGNMRARLPVYQLDKPADRIHPPAEQAGVVYRRPEHKRTLSPEVNLHGYRVDEALLTIDSLLDDAALEGMTALKIVHGKGTGALRRAIREHLSGHPLVAQTRPGEGAHAAAITIVQLH